MRRIGKAWHRAVCAAGGMSRGAQSLRPRQGGRVGGQRRQPPQKAVGGAKKHLGFDAKPSLESTAHIFESFCCHRAFSPLLARRQSTAVLVGNFLLTS
jgi:hypothetical protein